MTATSFFIALRKEHHSRLKQVAMNLLLNSAIWHYTSLS